MKLKKVIVSNNTLDGFEISGYLKNQEFVIIKSNKVAKRVNRKNL
jgi:hypothetical protein